MKVAFMFAGQGTQYLGMGKDLYETHKEARDVFDKIKLDFDVKACCFEGPMEMLQDTQYTQVAIFAHSMACAAVLEANGIRGDVCAGLSLGEYSALCYGASFTLQEGAEILRARGKLMANALPKGTSSMSAILMLDKETILKACAAVAKIGVCEIANYNCPGQIVITGEKAAVQAAGEQCLQMGARRVIPLAVSGAFHSSLLHDAGIQLDATLSNYTLKQPTLPVYHNISGKSNCENLQDILAQQISHSVLLEQTIMNMLRDGVDTFIEIGPGKAISGFIRKCAKGQDVVMLHVENNQTLAECIKAMKG